MRILDVNDVIKTQYMERNKFLPLPRRITTLEQCAKCFDILAQEIGDMADAFDQYFDDVAFIEMVLQENSSKFIKYHKVEKYINLKRARVEFIANMIYNYIQNGDVGLPNRRGYMPIIQDSVANVNGETSRVDTGYRVYNENRSYNEPNADDCYRKYGDCVVSFNRCIAAWNEKFRTRFAGAKLPTYYRH